MHLASDAPLATMCSGGVDSSLVTSYAKDGGGRFPSYVADVEGTVSEGAKALRVGQHIGVEVRPVCVSTADMVADWALATWHSEMPDVHPNSIPMLAVAKACQRDGIKVILTGEGADELFGGYSWYHDTYRMWRRRCRVSHLFAPLRLKGGWRLARALPWLGRIDQAARRGPVFAGMADTMSNGFVRRLMCAADPTRYVRPWALMKRLEGVAPRPQAAFLAQCLDDLHGHLQSLLLRNDRMCMAASVESRVPYIENALIDFALHLPFRAKRHAGQGKWLLKEVAATRLPRDIVYAPKIGFAFSARTYLSARPLIAAGIVPELFHWDHETTTAILDALGQDCSMMFHLGSLELWGRLFLRGESVDRVSELLVAAR